MSALTQDAFLGGRLHIWQPRDGYRAGVDPVLLAAATPAKAGQSVLELGCGVGVASLCLGARVEGLDLIGVELQESYFDLAVQNATENAIDFAVILADLTALPAALRQRSFDHVIANPPYYRRAHGTPAKDGGRDVALAGETPLESWIEIAAKRLAPKGMLTMIQRIERLPDLLAGVRGRLGSVTITPLTPRIGRAPELILMQALKDGRADFRLAPPVHLHEGTAHVQGKPDYNPLIENALRHGGAFDISR